MSFLEKDWKPTRKQAEFLSLPTTIKEAAFAGGAGSGKSVILLIYGICHKWHENPSFKQVFMRRTYQELRKEIVPRSEELYSKFGATFNKSEMIWTFPSGARIILAHCEEEKDIHRYDSLEINLFTPDEITSFTEYMYLYIAFTRVRTSSKDLPAITRTAGMPGNIGHSWFKKRFVDPYPDGGKIIIGKGGNKRIYIHATQADNPYIDPSYAQSLSALSEAEKKAKLYGDWSAYLGQVFDEFRDKKYPDEPENALHVVSPFDIPKWWPRFIIGDWGFAAMTYIGWYVVSPSKRVYLYRELYWYKTKIAEWAPIVKGFIEKEEPKVIKFCKSASQDRGTEHTVQQQIEEALGKPIELSNNSSGSRIAGKMLIHEYLRWKQKPSTPNNEVREFNDEHARWLLRNKGLAEYKEYISSFNPTEPEDNIPKLQIFCCNEQFHEGHPNCCPVMIDSIKACNYDKKSKDGKPAEDVAEFEGDDPYDDLRYAVDTADSYFDESNEEFKRVQKEATLIAQLNNTQDFTAFYRNSRTLEVESRVDFIPNMFHKKNL